MGMEIEAKIKVDDLKEIETRLRNLDATDKGSARERNYVLDDSSGGLLDRELLLRVRNHGGADAVLTVKQPAGGNAFKTREEVETRIDSTVNLLRQMEILGYRVSRIYEKRRHTWLWRNCVIALDECPEIGAFVEIEGDPDDIRAVCADLRLDSQAHISDNYLTLWDRHLDERGESRRDMVFASSTNIAGKSPEL